MFPFFQCPGTSPDRHEFSSIMECGLAAALANSFGTLGFILSVSMDFWTFRFLSGHKPNLLLQWEGICSLNPCLERCGKRDLPVETEAKYLDLSLLLVCYYPFPSCVYQRSILSLTSLFFSEIPIEALLIALSLAKFSSSQALAFLTPSLHNQAAFLLLYFYKNLGQ